MWVLTKVIKTEIKLTYETTRLKETVAIQRFISIYKEDKIFEKVNIYEFLDFIISNREDINLLISFSDEM